MAAGTTTVRELLIKWGFDVDSRPLKGLKSQIGNVTKIIAAAGAAGVAAAGTLFGLANSFAKAGDDAAKMSKRTGVGVEALQELKYVAELGGATLEDLDRGFKRLSAGMYDANAGLEASERTFRDLKIRVTDNSGALRSADDVLMDVADRFAGMTDATKKAALAQDLFGRSGMMLIPMLSEGRAGIQKLRDEARRFGIVIGPEMAAVSEQFRDDLQRAEAAVMGLKVSVGAGLLPIVHEQINAFRDWVMANRDLVRQKAAEWAEKLTKFVRIAWEWTKKAAEAGADLAREYGPTLKAALQAIGDTFKFMSDNARELAPLLAALAAAHLAAGVGALATGLVAAAKGMTALNAATKANIFVLAIASAVAGITALVTHWDELKNSWEEIKQIFDGVLNTMADAIDRFLRLPGVRHFAWVLSLGGKVGDAATWLAKNAGMKGGGRLVEKTRFASPEAVAAAEARIPLVTPLADLAPPVGRGAANLHIENNITLPAGTPEATRQAARDGAARGTREALSQRHVASAVGQL